MFRKPQRVYKNLKHFCECNIKLLEGKSANECRKIYARHLHRYRLELAGYYRKLEIVQDILAKLSTEEVRLLKLYLR
jgi:hypothetical protein